MPVARRIRWWPLLVIAAATAVAIPVARALCAEDDQRANILSVAIGGLAMLLTLAWSLLLSRLRRTTVLAGLLALAAVLAAALGLFRVRGVTGNLVPVLEWRFREPHERTAEVMSKDPGSAPAPGLLDSPQFFGPERTGRVRGVELATDWQAQPPELLWRHAVGAGWSGFAVAGRRAVTQEQLGDDEAVTAYDVLTGELLWLHRNPVRFDHPLGGIGPRATPTLDAGLVFAQGATGILDCLDLATGTRHWGKDLPAEHHAALPEYGFAGSPLALARHVVAGAGGPDGRSLVAYDKTSGTFAFGGGDEPLQWSSPVRATLLGREQVLVFHRSVAGHDATTGAVLWQHPWRGGHPHVCLPVPVGDDRVLVSSGYGTGSQLVRVHRDGETWRTEEVWRSLAMKAKFTNLVVAHGCAFGLDDGVLACIDLADGRRRWKRGRYGHGQVLLAGDLLLVGAENGEVVLVAADAHAHRELARFQAIDGKTWNPPALAGRYLLVRNDCEAACYRLPVRRGP